MKKHSFILLCLVFFILQILQSKVLFAAEELILSDPSELSFGWTLKNDIIEQGVVAEYVHPKQGKRTYIKPVKATLIKFSCNDKNIDLSTNRVENGYVSTVKYGKIMVGVITHPNSELIVWLSKSQVKKLKLLNDK